MDRQTLLLQELALEISNANHAYQASIDAVKKARSKRQDKKSLRIKLHLLLASLIFALSHSAAII